MKFRDSNGNTIEMNDRRISRISYKNQIRVEETVDFIKFKNTLESIIGEVEILKDHICMYPDVSYISTSIKLYDKHNYNITIRPMIGGRGVELFRFEMYSTGNGLGSKMMTLLNKVSFESDVEVYLIPGIVGVGSTKRTDTDFEKLRNFYHKFGFNRVNTKTRYWSNKKRLEILKSIPY